MTPAEQTDGGPAIGYEARLWAMVNALRSWTDDAKYEHAVLGSILSKYISDALEERHAAVPQEARGTRMETVAQQPAVGQTIDKAAA